MAQSKIEWTEATWNPTTGCDKVSQGCKNCYAEIMSKRLQAMGVKKYEDGFAIKEHPEALAEPYKWKKPQIVFVNSMSDLFHPDVSVEFIQRVFKVMKDTEHVYQLLTKRPQIVKEYDEEGLLDWNHNIWMGVSVEDQRVLPRIDLLRETHARVKFLSCEPLIGPLPELDLEGIDWVIVGGESGRKPRPMKEEWVLDIQEQCERANVSFFFKQWGGTNKKKNGRTLKGRTFDEMPG